MASPRANSTRRLIVQSLENRITPASAFVNALDLPANATVNVSEADFLAVAPLHNVVAGGLAGFPTGPNEDFVVLSNGDAYRAYGPRGSYSPFGLDFAPRGGQGDVEKMQITVPIAPGETHLKFDFDFMTDQFPNLPVPFHLENDQFKVKATPIGAGVPEDLVQMAVNDAPLMFGSPINAIYLFHTGTFTVDYRIPAGATAVVLDFEVNDQPDATGGGVTSHGGVDTAVAIDNFRITSANQTIWLDFEGSTLTDFPVHGGTATFPAFQPSDIRSAAVRSTLIDSIAADVAAKFADFDIDFVLTQPAFGPYGTITIGGTGANAVSLGAGADPRLLDDLGANTTLADAIGTVFGFAQSDFGNTSQTSSAYVASGEFDLSPLYFGEDETVLQQRLVVTIAHEVAHTLGTPHVGDFHDDNIMAQFSPRSPTAVFEDLNAFLPEATPDGRTQMNVHDYLGGVLGSSTGSTIGAGAALEQLALVFDITLGFELYDIVFALTGGFPDSEFGGAVDTATEIVTVPQLNIGQNQIALPNYGRNTKVSFYASTTPGAPPFIFSGTPSGGDMSPADGFVRLFDFSGEPNSSLPVAFGTLGALAPVPGGVKVKISPFATPGLKPIPAKTGFVFDDDKGNTVLVKLTSKTGSAAIELNDPDGDGKGSVARIELQGTTSKDKLEVKILQKSTFDHFVDIGAIFGTSLGKLNLKSANLTGAGLAFGGLVKDIAINDVLFGADIFTGGAFNTKTKIAVHEVFDGSDIGVDGQLQLSAARIGDGTIRAALLKSLTVKGDSKAVLPIVGNFQSDVTIVPGRTLTAKEAKLSLLGNVSIAGRTIGASFVVPGHAGKFKTGTFEDSSILVGYTPTFPLDPFAGGTFDGEFKLAGFSATGFNGFVGATFANSNLIAARVGPVSIASLNVDNPVAFGIAAKAGLDKNLSSIKVKDGSFTFDPTGVLPQSADDFFVKEI